MAGNLIAAVAGGSGGTRRRRRDRRFQTVRSLFDHNRVDYEGDDDDDFAGKRNSR